MTAVLSFIGLLIIFYFLAKICDEYFVKSLDIISKKLKLSEDVAGATFMAVGSSAPEFFTALISILNGSKEVGAGTIIGSAIFNILVIVGCSSIVAVNYLRWKPVVRDMIFYSLCIILLLFTFRDGIITMTEAIIYIVCYAIYIGVLANWGKFVKDAKPETALEQIAETMEKSEEKIQKTTNPIFKVLNFFNGLIHKTFPDLDKKPHLYWLTFTISLLYIIVFSFGLVELATIFAHQVGIPPVIIALTILAGGTSIPDLISSVIVAKQGRGDMAVSNAVGSNVFDILICLGFPWALYIVINGKQVEVGNQNLSSSILLLFFTVISLMFVLLLQKFKLAKSTGWFLLGLYGLYLIYAIYDAYNPGVIVFPNWV